MYKPKHTPGPWSLGSTFPDVDGYKIRGGSLAFRKGPRLIAVVKNQGERPVVEDSLSDARLIAAAPELYDALKTTVDCFYSAKDAIQFVDWFQNNFLTDCEKAIAKAEGRS